MQHFRSNNNKLKISVLRIRFEKKAKIAYNTNMTTTELISDAIHKLYHLKGAKLQKAVEMLSQLAEEKPTKKEGVGGKYKGQFVLKENFDDPLPKEILDGFNGLNP